MFQACLGVLKGFKGLFKDVLFFNFTGVSRVFPSRVSQRYFKGISGDYKDVVLFTYFNPFRYGLSHQRIGMVRNFVENC